jgi:archaellum component FlaC
MNDWTKSASSLELLETLRKDLEMLYEVASRYDADNIDASLHVVDALKERLENLPTLQEQSND